MSRSRTNFYLGVAIIVGGLAAAVTIMGVVLMIAYGKPAHAQVGPLGGVLLNMTTPAGGGGCTESLDFSQDCNSMYGGGKFLF